MRGVKWKMRETMSPCITAPTTIQQWHNILNICKYAYVCVCVHVRVWIVYTYGYVC